jgi:hypothetical protein
MHNTVKQENYFEERIVQKISELTNSLEQRALSKVVLEAKKESNLQSKPEKNVKTASTVANSFTSNNFNVHDDISSLPKEVLNLAVQAGSILLHATQGKTPETKPNQPKNSIPNSSKTSQSSRDW